MATIQKIIYIILSSFVNRSLTGIGYDRNLPHILLLFTIFEHMCLNTLSDEYNPHLKSVQLKVSKVLTFHEDIELLPSGYSYDLSRGNNEPTEYIMILIVGIIVVNKLYLVELVEEDW